MRTLLIVSVLCSLVVLTDTTFAASANKKGETSSNTNKYFACDPSSFSKEVIFYSPYFAHNVTKGNCNQCNDNDCKETCEPTRDDFKKYTSEGGSYVRKVSGTTGTVDHEDTYIISRSTGAFIHLSHAHANSSTNTNAMWIDEIKGVCELRTEKLKF